MPSIHFESVAFSYTSSHQVLRDVTVHLGGGWVGVVGPNGAGKSTFLRLLVGEIRPDSGSIVGDFDTVSSVDQSVELLDPTVTRFAESVQPEDYAMRGRLGLWPEMLDRWESLSPGERRRWQIASALASLPEVLILDEPTNHLDGEVTALLVNELSQFRGLGLIVSHDRGLLDGLCDKTLRVDHGTARLWSGNYSTASAEWRSVEASEAERLGEMKRRLKLEQREIAQQRQELEKRRAARRRQMRMARPNDHDTTSAARTKRAEYGQAKAGKRIRRLVDESGRLRDKIEMTKTKRAVGGKVSFRGDIAPRQDLVSFEGDLKIGKRTLAIGGPLVVERESRIRLAGSNGAGKSTLLADLADSWTLDEKRLLFLPQELSESQRRSVLAKVHGLSPKEKGRVLELVARLGTDPDVILASASPSLGEARKVLMAFGLGVEAWCLLLDEPTNHLDIPTIERLENAIAEYPGAVVIVSHDDRFAANITTETWTIEQGRITSL